MSQSVIYSIRMFVLRLGNLEWQWIRTLLILLWFRQLMVWVLALTREPVYLYHRALSHSQSNHSLLITHLEMFAKVYTSHNLSKIYTSGIPRFTALPSWIAGSIYYQNLILRTFYFSSVSFEFHHKCDARSLHKMHCRYFPCLRQGSG